MSVVAAPAVPAQAADTSSNSVTATGIVRRFGARTVLDQLDLRIPAREFVILLGQSGCGKSTLLRLLGGLDLPDGGTITVPRKRAIVFQEHRLLPWQRVWNNVTIGIRDGDRRAIALQVLEEVGLAGHIDAWPKTLSGGEAQRVSLARALVADPDLVLLDEPFAALDAITRLRMHDLVRGLRERHDSTMLLVTHDVDEAIALGDRILVMRDGRIADDHRVDLDVERRARGAARDDLRASLLSEIGLPPIAS
jgi:sulfonate transport system ATP-binding protein